MKIANMLSKALLFCVLISCSAKNLESGNPSPEGEDSPSAPGSGPSTPPNPDNPNPDEDDDDESDDDPEEVVLPEDFTISAAKDYSPSRFEPGTLILPASARLQIPSEWLVTLGNAGNHSQNKLIFPGLTCYFKGGSSQAHPSGSTQISLGQRYIFDTLRGCVDGSGVKTLLGPGDFVLVLKDEQVRMEIANGSHKFGRTEAQARLLVQSP